MRKALFVAAGIGLLFASTANAQRRGADEVAPVGSYAPSIEASEWLNVTDKDEIPSLVELRGLTVVIFFWVSWHEGGEALLPYVNLLSYSGQTGAAGGVYTIGVTDSARRLAQPLIDDAKVMFPVALESKSAAEYGFDQGFGFVVIDPTGKIAYKGSGTGDLNAMQKAVQDVQTETPPTKTHPMEAREIYRLQKKAISFLDDGKYGRVMDTLRGAFELAVTGDRLKSELFEMNDLVESLGYDELARVDPLLEQRKYDEAATVLREVMRRYKGFDCYRDARALHEELVKDNERFKQAADRFNDEDAAARVYLEGRDKLVARRYGESYDKLEEVVTEYPDTQAAEYAEAMLERMKQNSNFWSILKDHQAGTVCRQLLARARSLIGQRKYGEAEKILRSIIEDHAGTSWEREAVEEMKKLP